MKVLSRVSLKLILITTCLAFAIVPLALVTTFAWVTANKSAEEKAANYATIAGTLADKIDRNLFERYGDVQAFGLNRAVLDKEAWYVAGDTSPIVQAMNSYVDTYDIYYLTLLVDLDGKLIAVNTKDDSGNGVDTDYLYEHNFAQASWFRDCLARRFYESEDGSFTGTVMEHLYVDDEVKQVYGDEGLALGYSAPVYNENGEVVAVWKNVTKFGLVEDIVLATYEDLKSQGMGSAEITLLDDRGNVIVDCDPSTLGRDEIARDMSIIGKFNLVESGVEAATRVVAGETGSITRSHHTRKQIDQVAGFAPFKGALGFPGMQWNALVRVAASEALAAQIATKQTCLWLLALTALVVWLAAWVFARAISKVLKQTVDSMEAAAGGDYSKRVSTSLSSDLSRMSVALDTMLDSLTEAEAQTEEAVKLRQVVEDSDSAFMLVDRDLNVTYVNKATQSLMNEHSDTFAKHWSRFNAEALTGTRIFQFFESSEEQQQLLSDPSQMPYRSDLEVGAVVVEVNITPIYNSRNEHVGSTLVWEDVTEKRQQEARDADFRGQLESISAAQAVIEFDLDANIVTANDNFLAATGYSLDEIQGKPHRTFIDPSEAASGEYRKFWDDLRRGETKSGEFRRLRKDGSGLWIQASYNPICDPDGKIVKVVKFATDISATKEMELQVQQQQQREKQQAEEQQRKTAQLLDVVNAVAAGDMTVRMPDLGDDAVGKVARGVEKAVNAIRVAMSQVRDVAITVATSARELSVASDQISNGAQTQASSLEETAASLEEITSTVKQNTDNSQQAQQLASSSREVAESGGDVVSHAVDAMSAINDASKKIAEIITTIDEIAFQTNLLALNAAVEAARAGEQGRGFAVVASEVRNLAQRSAGAAKEIKNLIQDSVTKVENGTELVNRSGETLQEIVTSVKRVADIVTEISAASTEQLTGIEQVNNAVSQMDRVTQTNAAQTEEMAGTSQSLLSHSEQLQQLVSAFRLGDDQAAFSPAPASTPAAVRTTPQWDEPLVETMGGEHELDLIGAGIDDGNQAGDFIEF